MYRLNTILSKVSSYAETLSVFYRLTNWGWGLNQTIPTKDEIDAEIRRAIFELAEGKDVSTESGGLRVQKELIDKQWYYTVSFIYDLRIEQEDADLE